jgi:hypothetical protein
MFSAGGASHFFLKFFRFEVVVVFAQLSRAFEWASGWIS